jgi:hypothetical protein
MAKSKLHEATTPVVVNDPAPPPPTPETVPTTDGGDPPTNGGDPKANGGGGEPLSIAKPKGRGLDRFKSKRGSAIASVETMLGSLPHGKISDANDFVRLHPNEDEYWSGEFCFVRVPIQGQKGDLLHLIDEDLAMAYLSNKNIIRHRLALAAKPYDVFFLCHVPSQNLDNSWNKSTLEACEKGKSRWVRVASRKAEGVESYKTDYAADPDAFPEPKWPKESLEEIIEKAFEGHLIDHEDHPGLRRLRGKKQDLA